MAMHHKLVFVILLYPVLLFSQSKIDIKVEEMNNIGTTLYFSEKASWVATDLFFKEYAQRTDNVDGYFSYPNNGKFTCVFSQNVDLPMTNMTITLDSTFNVENAVIDTNSRKFTENEKTLYNLRLQAQEEIETGYQILMYDYINFNIIPIIYNHEPRVYIISATNAPNKMVLGNDYLLKFNKKNILRKVIPLHRGILEFEADSNINWVYHSHLKKYNQVMTETDVCTLLLYGDVNECWQKHIVVSKKYISIWNYNLGRFAVMEPEVFFQDFEFEK